MEQHRIDTHNAVELYLKYQTRASAAEVITSLARWPFEDRLRNAGKFMAAIDALSLKHGAFGSGLLWRLGLWLTRKCVPPARPTWNDYWLLYWTLTKDMPLLAKKALSELHRRAFHLSYDTRDDPEWALAGETAFTLVRRECAKHPEFAEAFSAEICRCVDERQHRLMIQLPDPLVKTTRPAG